MKKISLLCATALLCSALGSPIYAEAVFKVNDVPYEHGDAICMNHDNGDLINVSTFNEGVYVLLASQDGKHICYSKFLKQ